MARYTAAFAPHGLDTGQVLLTADDLMRRGHYRNAQRTLDRLLDLKVVPVINENDTVATDEIRFGDNDRLAALVAHVTRASALILLSDVDGLTTGPEKGERPPDRRRDPARGPAARQGEPDGPVRRGDRRDVHQGRFRADRDRGRHRDGGDRGRQAAAALAGSAPAPTSPRPATARALASCGWRTRRSPEAR